MLINRAINLLNDFNQFCNIKALLADGAEYYLGVLGKISTGDLAISLDAEPFIAGKNVQTLLNELNTYKDQSDFYNESSQLYLSVVEEHDDESYDFVYFDIEEIRIINNEVFLIAGLTDINTLRESY